MQAAKERAAGVLEDGCRSIGLMCAENDANQSSFAKAGAIPLILSAMENMVSVEFADAGLTAIGILANNIENQKVLGTASTCALLMKALAMHGDSADLAITGIVAICQIATNNVANQKVCMELCYHVGGTLSSLPAP